MPKGKQLWVLAGANGAGKSTFYKHYLEKHGVKLVNADLIAKKLNPKNPEKSRTEAAQFAAKLSEDLLSRRASFCFETVFCHESKIDFIARAKGMGFKIIGSTDFVVQRNRVNPLKKLYKRSLKIDTFPGLGYSS